MKVLAAVCCLAGTLALGIVGGGTPRRDVFVKVTVTEGSAAPDTVIVSASCVIPANVAVGQKEVPTHTFSLLRISQNWEDPAYLIGMRFALEDAQGSPLDPLDVISHMYVEVELPAETGRLPNRADVNSTGSNVTGFFPAELGRGGSLRSDPEATAGGGIEGDVTNPMSAVTLPRTTHPTVTLAGATSASGAYLNVELPEPAFISSAGSLKIHCYVDIATAVRVPGFVIKLDEDSILLDYGDCPRPSVIVRHEEGPGTSTYAATTVIPGTLRDSMTNYPNPFAAGRESTILAFYLHREAEVRLRLFTGFGRLVKTLDPGTVRSGGIVHEDIRWDGTDDNGAIVQNGAYFAVLEVRYTGGGTEQAVRKVAVLR